MLEQTRARHQRRVVTASASTPWQPGTRFRGRVSGRWHCRSVAYDQIRHVGLSQSPKIGPRLLPGRRCPHARLGWQVLSPHSARRSQAAAPRARWRMTPHRPPPTAAQLRPRATSPPRRRAGAAIAPVAHGSARGARLGLRHLRSRGAKALRTAAQGEESTRHVGLLHAKVRTAPPSRRAAAQQPECDALQMQLSPST